MLFPLQFPTLITSHHKPLVYVSVLYYIPAAVPLFCHKTTKHCCTVSCTEGVSVTVQLRFVLRRQQFVGKRRVNSIGDKLCTDCVQAVYRLCTGCVQNGVPKYIKEIV
jgi:hypothetical protein